MAYIQSVEEQNTYGNIDLPCEADRKYGDIEGGVSHQRKGARSVSTAMQSVSSSTCVTTKPRERRIKMFSVRSVEDSH